MTIRPLTLRVDLLGPEHDCPVPPIVPAGSPGTDASRAEYVASVKGTAGERRHVVALARGLVQVSLDGHVGLSLTALYQSVQAAAERIHRFTGRVGITHLHHNETPANAWDTTGEPISTVKVR